MAHKSQEAASETSSWITESDQYDIANEVEWACTRLQHAIRDEKAARESLESLFKKRREDASNGVKKAQRRLKFVNQEEERLRKTLLDKVESGEVPAIIVTNRQIPGGEKDGTVNQVTKNQTVLGNFFQQLAKENARVKMESAAKETPSCLERYIGEEEADIQRNELWLNKYKEEAKELLQLIARLEEPGHIVTGSSQEELGSERSEFEGRRGTDVVKPTENDGPIEGDIALLKERLKKAETNIKWQSRLIQEKKSRIDSYRRLLAVSSS